MRRRALRMIARVMPIAPVLMAAAAHAQAPGPATKDERGREAMPAAARLAPTPSDVAPADPVGAAFDLFGARRAAPAAAIEAVETPVRAVAVVPPPAVVAEVEPGVVAVQRPPSPAGPAPEPASVALAPAASESGLAAYAAMPTAGPIERVLVEVPAVAAVTAGMPRPPLLPVPRRRPAITSDAVEAGDLRLASATPEPVVEPARQTAPIAAETAVFGEPKKIPKAAEPYMALIRREAAANKVPLWLAVGVGWVESKYQPNLRGSHGVVGLMQVMPSTARFQGYKGPTEKLLEPETNIVWGMKELGWTWKDAKGDACLAIAKYKGGIRTKSISPAAADYCKRAKAVTGMG